MSLMGSRETAVRAIRYLGLVVSAAAACAAAWAISGQGAERNEAAPPPVEPPPVVLSFAGDIMSHDVNLAARDYSLIYAGIAELRDDDASFGNFEAPVVAGRRTSGYPTFNSSAAYLDAAVEGGFDFLSLANNHANDLGAAGMKATYKAFGEVAAARGIAFSGLRGDATKPFPLAVRVVRGLRIGFAAVTTITNAPDRAGFLDFVDFGADGIAELAARVAEWRKGCDFLVLSVHDGVEYSQRIGRARRAALAALAEAGADIVWAHHPHVPGGWEAVAVERGGEPAEALVLHSLGNFVSGYVCAVDPAARPNERTPACDCLIMRVELSAAGKLLRAEPRYYSAWNDPVKGVVVRDTAALAAGSDIPDRWRSFYAARLAAMKALGSPWTTEATR